MNTAERTRTKMTGGGGEGRVASLHTGRFGSFLTDLYKNREFFLLLLPGLLCIICFNYLPMGGLVIAFKRLNYADGIFGSPWCGFDNFKLLLRSPDLFLVIRNTLLYNAVFIIMGATVPVALAIMLSMMRNKGALRVYQGAMFFPYFLSWVVVSYIVYTLMQYDYGVFNRVVMPFLGMEPVNWYNDTRYWPGILIFLNLWKSVGYNCVMYYAAIMGIDADLYEAAAIDGAGKFRQAMTVTVPAVIPMVIMLAILNIGKIFHSDFGLFYQTTMDSGALLPVTNVVDTYVFRSMRFGGDMGLSSAASFIQSIVGFVLVLVTNLVVKRIDESNALM